MSVDRQPAPAPGAVPSSAGLAGRYQLGEQVAVGAFFTTYRGRETQTGRPVAIKVLRPEYAADAAFQERLVREANAARALQHAGIAAVYEAWRERGTVVIVTEFVRGINLKERIRRVAPFPLRVAVEIAAAVAEALEHAANAGFVHGDLRPENIIVTPEGHVKVTDFGVGVALAESARTQMSALPCSAYYLSPDVAQGRPPDSRSDIYALGAILYEMLAASVPFEGESPLAVAARHLHDPPPSLRRKDPGIPVAVDGICLKAMQKSPADRYATPGAMLADLRAVRDALIYRRPLNWSPIAPPVVAPAGAAATLAAAPATVASARYFSKPAAAVEAEDDGPSWKILLLGLFGIVAIIGSAFVFARVVFQPLPERQVPAVVGRSVEEATRILLGEKLKPRVVEQYHTSQPAGRVYSQDPGARSVVKEGSEVTIFVSQGPRPIQVPDVSGFTVRAARNRIREAGLAVGQVEEQYHETARKGEVILQTPAGGSSVKPGTAVDLVISKGPEPVTATPPVELSPAPEVEAPPPAPAGDLPKREFDLVIRVPFEASASVRVRVSVTDEDGTRHDEYDQLHAPGEEVHATVSGRGHEGRVGIRVYFDERIVHNQQL